LRSVKFSSNLKLRQALSMAIDRPTIEKALLYFGQVPAYGFVPPGTANYEPQAWEWKSLPDVERTAQARALFGAAGYSTREPLHLRLLYNSNPALKRLSVAVASMWREVLGIETELIDEENRVFLNSRKDSARWDVARLGWMADYNDAGNFLDIFRSGAANNDAGYTDPQFDSLLDDAEASADPKRRHELLEQAERVMLADYPVIPIYFYSSKRLIKPYVKGARPNPLNRIYSKDLYIEPK
jgi:oligopeptide transport system substrate-binding protein